MSNSLPESYESAKADFALFRAEEFIPTVGIAPDAAEPKKSKPFSAQRLYPAIILAGGMSRRMGQAKALLPIGGTPMIRRIFDTCLASGSVDEVVVVTGYESSLIQEVLADRAVNFVHNLDYETGEMLSSVRAGVRALATDCTAFFLLPCDQPSVLPSTFIALANGFRETLAPVVLPVYLGKRGHPVLISSALIPDILGLATKDTLKSALFLYRDRSLEVEVDDPGILFDIDTPEEYERAIACLH